MISYEEEIWMAAASDAEHGVMRCLPTIPGGKNPGESVDKYAERCRVLLSESFRRLKIARDNLNAIRSIKKSKAEGEKS